MPSLSFWLFIDDTSLKKTTSKEFKIKDELISNKNELENFKIDDPLVNLATLCNLSTTQNANKVAQLKNNLQRNKLDDYFRIIFNPI